jgi:hypothetical protein
MGIGERKRYGSRAKEAVYEYTEEVVESRAEEGAWE